MQSEQRGTVGGGGAGFRLRSSSGVRAATHQQLVGRVTTPPAQNHAGTQHAQHLEAGQAGRTVSLAGRHSHVDRLRLESVVRIWAGLGNGIHEPGKVTRAAASPLIREKRDRFRVSMRANIKRTPTNERRPL